ncbi:hypothetical protein BT69DRAFT_1004510 [Atractiella rhizophila]|nr:hypothetical protein BT69DRAFT_1004510 [Atractiella rhizophila]
MAEHSDYLPTTANGLQGEHAKSAVSSVSSNKDASDSFIARIPLQRLTPCLSRLPLSVSNGDGSAKSQTHLSVTPPVAPTLLRKASGLSNSSSSFALSSSSSSSSNLLEGSYQSSVLSTSTSVDQDDSGNGDGGACDVKYSSARLPSIDDASAALHVTLKKFRPITHSYADVPYRECFNWDALELDEEIEGQWYIVAFRSLRKPQLEEFNNSLYEADYRAHEEAIANGGLLMYWYGLPNETGHNLATCIWQSEEQAKAARYGKEHAKAMYLTRDSYVRYDLERYLLVKEKGTRKLEVRDYVKA